jgi:hypothetical protein
VSGRVTVPPERHEPQPAIVRYRRWLLIPVLPVLAFIAIVVTSILLSLLPGPATQFVTIALWAATLAHALFWWRLAWLVGMIVFPPTTLAYGIWLAFGLQRAPDRTVPRPPYPWRSGR